MISEMREMETEDQTGLGWVPKEGEDFLEEEKDKHWSPDYVEIEDHTGWKVPPYYFGDKYFENNELKTFKHKFNETEETREDAHFNETVQKEFKEYYREELEIAEQLRVWKEQGYDAFPPEFYETTSTEVLESENNNADDPLGFGILSKGWTLLRAAADGELAVAESLIKQGIDVNWQDPQGRRSALHMAARRGQDEFIRMLLRQGVHVDLQDIHGFTPLHEAVRKQHIKTSKLLLEEGKADISMKDYKGRQVLNLVLDTNSSVEIMELLVNQGATPDSDIARTADFCDKYILNDPENDEAFDKVCCITSLSHLCALILFLAAVHCNVHRRWRNKSMGYHQLSALLACGAVTSRS